MNSQWYEVHGADQNSKQMCLTEFAKLTYEKIFYRHVTKGKMKGKIYGWPGLARMGRPTWCTGELKKNPFQKSSHTQGANINIVRYLGIAADEPERIKRHTKPGIILPLVEIGWDESYCRKWCEENDLLSPIYTTAARGGCWFCHNQSASQLRLLRKTYPELWNLLLKWDSDSPTTFKPDGHTVHDFEKRFAAEDRGEIKAGDRKFRWKQVLEDKK